MSVPTATACMRNWRVILSRFDFLGWRSSSPKRVRCALLGAGHYAWEQWRHCASKPHSKCREDIRLHRLVQIRHDDTGMYCHGLDSRIAARELTSEENVGKFGLAVTAPSGVVLEGRLVKDHAAGGRHMVTDRGEVHDAHIGVWLFSSYKECGKEQPGEKRMTHHVCSELILVSILCNAVCCAHDTRIVDEEVEAGRFACESFSGRANGGKGSKIERKVFDWRIWDGFLDFFDCSLCLGSSTCC